MKRWICLLAILIISSANLFGVSYYSTGDGYYDFGNPFDIDHNNKAPYNYPNVGYLPSPGNHSNYAGELYDMEGLFVACEGDQMYVSLTTSFGVSAYSQYFNQNYMQGDIFFGFGGNNDRYAIEVETGNLVKVGVWSYIQNVPGSYYGNSTIRDEVGAFNVEMLGKEVLGSANQRLTDWANIETDWLGGASNPTGGDSTYIWEWKFDIGDLDGWNGEDLEFHTTLGCGNDFITAKYPSAIPEPGTLILLGLGLAGAGILTRRRR